MTRLEIKILEGPGQLPVHLQIVYSLEYAIGFGQLSGGSKLPSVRSLATQLGVAPNTVARAYQQLQDEGLIVTYSGRGTYVTERFEGQGPAATSASILREMLEPIVVSARSIGFSPDRIREMVDGLLADVDILVGFVGINQRIVEKWSALLKATFGDLIKDVIGLPLDEVQRDPAGAAKRLEPACCVFTLTSTWTAVRDLLGPEGVTLSTLLSELSTATHRQLGSLPTLGSIGLVCRDFYVSSLYGILSAYLDLERVRRVSPDDDRGLGELCATTDVIIYTLDWAEKIVPMARPGTRLIELEYVPNQAAFQQLRARLRAAASSKGAGDSSS